MAYGWVWSMGFEVQEPCEKADGIWKDGICNQYGGENGVDEAVWCWIS
jgi:hypothetical protein